ncbi:DUF2806 domain-containing protein [Candidatus Gracilibacteria bacterium]|nr:DUF2806 domain-containing protein [Candidatus Gracilibacteria bacterium]
MSDLKLPENNKIVGKILFAWYGGWAGYLEYQKSKKIADAMAENEANKIKIAGELEEKVIREQIKLIESLEQADKFVEYKNLYGVLTKAVPKFQNENIDTEIDPDKLKRLKDLSKEFSSDEMQEYIAGILAGEYNNPGSYSLKTMEIIKNLTRDDINLFKKFCGLVINGFFILSDITNNNGDDFRKANGLDYTEILYLQELGLISFKESSLTLSTTGEGENKFGQTIFQIGNRKLFLRFKIDKQVNIITITNSGKELMGLLTFNIPDSYFNWINDTLNKKGFETEFLGEKN